MKRAYHATLGKWLVNLAVDRIRAVSRWEEDELRGRGFRPVICHIPSGIEDRAFADIPPLDQKASNDQLANLGRYLIQVGKIKRVKNHITLIRALEKLPADIKLVIVGQVIEAGYCAELKDAINRLNLSGRVFFTGYVDAERKYYLIQNALAVVNLPPIECYGSVVYEAMARGAVLIVAKGTAPGRLALDNQCGIAVDPASERETVNALKFVLDVKNSSALRAMREKAKAAVKSHSWEAVSLRFMDLLRPKRIAAGVSAQTSGGLSAWPAKGRAFFGRLAGFGRKIIDWRPSERAVITAFLVFAALILALSLRGQPGNPQANDLNSQVWTKNGPFELSPERGRFALLYSLAENKSLSFTDELAKFVVPDLGLAPDGRFVSLFPPGVSFLAWPGYLIGRWFNLAQIGAFAVIALFALANGCLIVAISRRLGAGLPGSLAGASAFLFATPAFAYAVTFYQHHVTVFLLLLCLYLLLRFRSFKSLATVWLLIGLSWLVDSPNFFLFLPIGFYAIFRAASLRPLPAGWQFSLQPRYLAAVLLIGLPLIMLGWYNYRSHGDPLKLSGTLPAVAEISPADEISSFKAADQAVYENTADKQAIGFFATRNLLRGFYTHIVSPDRGILRFTPVILLGVFGLFALYRRQSEALNIFLAVIGLNILLYSMWGDPYGGWAFGSRYLIPSYALLAVGLAVWLSSARYWLAASLIFLCAFSYSAWVNSLGALTSNMNPPQIEVLALEAASGKEEKYTYERNWDFLIQEGSKSFAWRTYFRETIPALTYHRLIFGLIMFFVWLALFYSKFSAVPASLLAAVEQGRRLIIKSKL
ncbi:MAG: glycosyltransferase family 4 protein [Planctomycetes bacterium]|nr:glycosyltransferase family 4 protein [Planctomycetota bacterium]